MLHVIYRSCIWFACISVLSVGLFQDPVEARIFGRLRKGGGGGDGNIPGSSNAPVAPANLSDDYGMPTLRCNENGCEMQPMPQVPQGIAIPTLAPTRTVIQSPRTAVVSRIVPNATSVGDSVFVAIDANRISRILDLVESKLGLEAEPAMTGNPTAMFNDLPIIEVVRKRQDGTVEDTVELNTKLWIKRQLGLSE